MLRKSVIIESYGSSFFSALGRFAYAAADPIVALFGDSQRQQIRDGAQEQRTCIVANGINIGKYRPLRALRPDPAPPVLGLIGRVVPIKDIKTFIRSIRTIVQQYPEAEAWIIGPEDESPEYANECHILVESMGLQDKVKFLGFQQISEILNQN